MKRDEIVGHLSVRMNGYPCAELRKRRNGTMQLQYLPEWVERSRSGRAEPLSVALPIRSEPYEDDEAHPFFAGLLPDATSHRQRLGEIFHVAAEDDFSLLGAIGRDCAGAVSVVPVDAEVVPETQVPEDMEPLDDAKLAQLIRDFPVRPLFSEEDETYLISLAGVNDKAAVLVKNGVIGLPRRSYPSSHILKVDMTRLKDSIKVEHFCLRLAKELGMKVPNSRIRMADDIAYMLIARYDRVVAQTSDGPRLRRVHQEDFCQALGLPPTAKFEKAGGPGWKECFDLIAKVPDLAGARIELLNRALFTYLIANSDGHAKNLSLLHRNGAIHLAPLYDVNCQRAYLSDYKRVVPYLTMAIGGSHDPTELTGRHWDDFADACGFRAIDVRRRLSELAARLPDVLRKLREEARGTPADSPRLDLVAADVESRCAAVPAMLGPRPKSRALRDAERAHSLHS